MIDRDMFQNRMQEKVDVLGGTPAMLACLGMMNDLATNFDPASATHAAALNVYGDALMIATILDSGEPLSHTQTDFTTLAAIMREAAEMFDDAAKRSAN